MRRISGAHVLAKMADRKGRSVIFRTPFTASLKEIKDAISEEIGADKITVLQQLSNGEYLVELTDNKLAEELIESGFAMDELQSFPQKSYEFPLKLSDLWITSLLFDLNNKFINGSFAFSPS